MNVWLLCANVLLLCLVPCGVVVFRGSAMDRLVGLEMAGMIDVLLLLVLAEGFPGTP